jgi:hypothetical protein
MLNAPSGSKKKPSGAGTAAQQIVPIAACACCSTSIPFELPPHLVKDLIADRAVIFAGAGISTEGKNVLNNTLHEEIFAALGLTAGEIEFPDLMERFCDRPNGRIELIEKIKFRFEHINAFPDLHWYATAFHRELSTLYTVTTIVTTNWDTYFETECHATPFVTSQDLALFGASGRKVIKLHGSITSYGSLVITRGDYARCENRLTTGTLGGLLKSLFATKTVIFCGYSARDEDLQTIINSVRTEMGPLSRQHYIVHLDRSADAQQRFQSLGLSPIVTDATHFIRAAKKEVFSNVCSIDDEAFYDCMAMLSKLKLEHLWLCDAYSMFERPETIFCASYQDGFLHSFERMKNRRASGEYTDRHRIEAKVATYARMREEYLKSQRYEDVAYIDGYTNGLIFMLMSSAERSLTPVPLYYLYGVKESIRDRGAFVKLMKGKMRTPRAILRRAAKIVALVPKGQHSGIVFDHRAWL